MPLFTKKPQLVSVWKGMKKDAERARGGKKPGGKMNFEDKIEKIDKELLSNDPKLDQITKQIATLVKEMADYSAKLPDEEREFAKDIKSFIKMLNEVNSGVVIAEERAASLNAKSKALLIRSARVGKLLDAYGDRITKLNDEIANCHDAGQVKTLAGIIKKLQDSIDNEIQKEQADVLAGLMKLEDGSI